MGDFIDGSIEDVAPVLDPMHLDVEPGTEPDDPLASMTDAEYAAFRSEFFGDLSGVPYAATTQEAKETQEQRTAILRRSMIETPDSLRVRTSLFLQERLGKVGLRRFNR